MAEVKHFEPHDDNRLIDMLSRGFTTERIAKELKVSTSRIRNRIYSIRIKNKCYTIAQLVAKWIKEGIE